MQSCAVCAKYSSAQQPQLMLPTEKPTRPLEIVGADMFTILGKNYLVTCYHYSGYFEVDLITSMTSAFLIKKLKAHFSRYGIPVKFLSDNGPQFLSEEFTRFTEKWKFTRVTSSPYYPKDHGTAEAVVKIAKTLLRKAAMSKSDAYCCLTSLQKYP